jgi:hypothetical protein
MKLQPKRLLAALLAGLMILPTAACAAGDDPKETQSPGATSAETEADTGYKPDIETKDYDCDFTILGVETLLSWMVADESAAGDSFQETIYERGVSIKDHLGVELALIQGANGIEYANDIVRTVQAGDDAYQLVAAACHNGVYTLLNSNAMYDFAELDAIDMDAPYWSLNIMEEYLVSDRYLVGYNDACLANAACMVFNKDLAIKYRLKEPYDDVRNMAWTLDKMNAFVSNVAEDNGDGVWDVNDVYGITGDGQIDFISLVTACGIKMVDKDEEDIYHVAYDDNADRMLDFLKKVERMDQAEYSFFGKPQTELNGVEVSFDDGNAMLRMQQTSELVSMRQSAVRFGVLPYPMYDEAQGEYRSLNWNGLLMIPGAIKDPVMVGEVVELLAYYTAPVKIAFFEELLGAKLAEAPEDAEMLNMIWDSQSNDVCLAASADATLADILYMVPFLCRDGVDQYASYMKRRVKVADKALDRLFNPKLKK